MVWAELRLFLLDARAVIFACIALGAAVIVSIRSSEAGLIVFLGFVLIAVFIVFFFAKRHVEKIRELLSNSHFVVVDILDQEVPKFQKFPLPDTMVELNGLVRGGTEQRVKLLPATSCVYALMKYRHIIFIESQVDGNRKLRYFRLDWAVLLEDRRRHELEDWIQGSFNTKYFDANLRARYADNIEVST